jgi:type I restriction enzyme M protein
VALEEYEINFMDKLWESAKRLRGKMEASQYKHIFLPLIFFKYISDMFESRRKWLENALRDPKNEDYYLPNATEEDIKSILEDCDGYLSVGVFYVSEKARRNWPTIGIEFLIGDFAFSNISSFSQL